MQTFLPYKSFIESAKCLDYRRLGKQRVEAKQIIDAIEGNSTGWVNHPCVKMWRDYVDTLKLYHDIVIMEWKARGYKNNMPMFHEEGIDVLIEMQKMDIPGWLDDDFCSRHRSALLFKDYEYYSRYGWTEEPKLDYRWE